VKKYDAVFVLILLLTSPLTAAAKTKQSPPLADSMSVEQARRALLSAADSLFVSVNRNAQQTIDEKSMRVSLSSVVFDGAAADSINDGKHRYIIRFANFTSVSAQCDKVKCEISSEPAGTLVRNEAGESTSSVYFHDTSKEPGRRRTTCSAACRRIALDFAAALNSLHAPAIKKQGASSEFHQQAANWRALNPKPLISEEVRVNRLLAEDAVKNNKPAEALGYYETGLELDPTWPQGCFNAALIAAELGFYTEAVEHMQAYLELVPDAPDAQSARDQILIWKHK
jgi:tetratricopeptide (TPR) repeat protein